MPGLWQCHPWCYLSTEQADRVLWQVVLFLDPGALLTEEAGREGRWAPPPRRLGAGPAAPAPCWCERGRGVLTACFLPGLSQRGGVPVPEQDRGRHLRGGVQSKGQENRCVQYRVVPQGGGREMWGRSEVAQRTSPRAGRNLLRSTVLGHSHRTFSGLACFPCTVLLGPRGLWEGGRPGVLPKPQGACRD